MTNGAGADEMAYLVLSNQLIRRIGQGGFAALAYLVEIAEVDGGELVARTSSRKAAEAMGHGPDTARRRFRDLMRSGLIRGEISRNGCRFEIERNPLSS